MKHPRALWLLFLAGLAGVCPSLAHELGTIRTTATFRRDGTYDVLVVIDREHLPSAFGAAGGVATRYGPIRGLPADLSGRAVSIMAEVINDSGIAFDGRPAAPGVQWVEGDPASAVLAVRLAGRTPAAARTFTWSNSARLGSYLLTVRFEGDENPVREWMEGGQTSRPFPLAEAVVPPTRWQVVAQYLALGFTHIVPRGSDHILFVLGIFLLSPRVKPVLLQVTAFTAAHTITLALTIYGFVSLKASIVEPLIAFSIVFVAVENVATPKVKPWRIALVFCFGLVHGMGFAGVLGKLGLPRSEFPAALFSFNAGVELGQLAVLLAAFLLLRLPFRSDARYRQRVVVPVSLAIAAVGLYWAVVRVLPGSR
ncbi:MAG TPA: HupE/UreJ family protein [Thermoanaerobaculia bacterium]|nr:HupE/UreJ family protein [Thermoanaerobaculia bacterium]